MVHFPAMPLHLNPKLAFGPAEPRRKYSPVMRADIATEKCRICDRLFGEHSDEEFDSCFQRLAFCEICQKKYSDHSDEELDACFTTLYNSGKYPGMIKDSWKRLPKGLTFGELIGYIGRVR